MNPRKKSRNAYGRIAKEFLLLLRLLKMSSNRGELVTTASRLAELANMPKRSVSAILEGLASDGWIVRKLNKEGERVLLTSKAYHRIAQELSGVSIPDILLRSERTEQTVTGTVFTGKGEGAYYVSQRQYFIQMQEKLGFMPYPGTLNLRLSDFDDLNKILLLHSLPPIRIAGFSTHERTFGDVLCHEVRITGELKVYLARSERTSYDLTVAELISDVYLRKALHVKDGDPVRFSFFP